MFSAAALPSFTSSLMVHILILLCLAHCCHHLFIMSPWASWKNAKVKGRMAPPSVGESNTIHSIRWFSEWHVKWLPFWFRCTEWKRQAEKVWVDLQTQWSGSRRTWSSQTDLLLWGKLETALESHWSSSSGPPAPESGPTQLHTKWGQSGSKRWLTRSKVTRSVPLGVGPVRTTSSCPFSTTFTLNSGRASCSSM